MLPDLCRAGDLRPLAAIAAAVTGFAGLCTAFVWATAEAIVALLYGPAYGSATPALRILALAFPLMSLNYALTTHLVAWRRQRTYAVLCACALAANLALNAWLIPAWSIEGAAWATLGTEVVLTAGCLAALSPRS
jgi:O-antigen/teichoic acid export membrane protein